LVSHDPHLVEAVADQLYLVKDGTVSAYNDDLDAYRRLVIEQRRKENSDSKKEKNKKSQGDDQKSQKDKQKAVEKAEQELNKWTAEKASLEAEMATPKAINQPKVMSDLVARYAVVEKEVQAAESAWIAAQGE
jgi:ATP-binding cassette subfamily F protein 3